MMQRTTAPRNFLLLALSAGCAATEPVSAPLPKSDARAIDIPTALARGHGRRVETPASWHGPSPTHLSELDPDAPRAEAAPTSVMAQVGPSLEGVVVDATMGEDLADALADADPDELAAYGPGVLPIEELFGEPYLASQLGVCEYPEVEYTFSEDDADWEARLQIPAYMHFVAPITPSMITVDDTCREALVTAGGDVDAAADAGGCADEVVQTFFAEGSDCRSCVATDGLDACEDAGTCPTEAVEQGRFGTGEWYNVATTYSWACAPDWVTPVRIGYTADDGALPAYWDHENWAYTCVPLRLNAGDPMDYFCLDGYGGPAMGDAIGEGVFSRVKYIREVGETDTPHAERVSYLFSMELEGGVTVEHMWLTTDGIGIVSLPQFYEDGNGDGVLDGEDYATSDGGWDFNPARVRPDGTDPFELDDTYARDWVAAVSLKTATTITGVLVNPINWSRCVEWEGPGEDGAYTCVATGDIELGWGIDRGNGWVNTAETQYFAMPMITLGSTGLPDPLVPGGLVPHIAGTPDLANPDWEGCAWPDTFVPDRIPVEDTPLEFDGPASLDGATYKFGKDPDRDLRVVLATNRIRGFCPEG